MNILGALVKPKGMTNHSYNPNLVLKRVNDNAYRLELLEGYDVHATFNVADLILFAGGTDDEAETKDLRTNHSQEGGDDEMSRAKGP